MQNFVIAVTLLLTVACKQSPSLPHLESKPKGAHSEKPTGSDDQADSEKPKDSEITAGEEPAAQAADTLPITFQYTATTQDPIEFTVGSSTLTFTKALKAGEAVTRYFHATDLATLTLEQKAALSLLCGNTDIAITDKTAQLSWRSHYSAGLKRVLNQILTTGHSDLLCVTNVGDVSLIFDPVLSKTSILATKSDKDKAVALGLMMPVLRSAQSPLNKANLGLVQKSSVLPGKVKALVQSDLIAKPQGATPDCFYNVDGMKLTVGNATEQKSFTYDLPPEMGAKIAAITAASIGGRILKSCASVSLKKTDVSTLAQLNCGVYQSIKDEGIEAGCSWDITAVNGADAGDDEVLKMDLPKLTFAQVTPPKVPSGMDAFAAVPVYADNPLTKGRLQLKNFSDQQKSFMSRGLDLWAALSLSDFNDGFNYKMKTLEVMNGGYCDKNYDAYTFLGTTNINFCPKFTIGRVPSEKTVRDDYLRLLDATAHESRHAIKSREHDMDDKSYAPCTGTAQAAFLMKSAAVDCKLDYCKLSRDQAVSNFIFELNYSLEGDARRFQGLCKEWSDAMGIKEGQIK